MIIEKKMKKTRDRKNIYSVILSDLSIASDDSNMPCFLLNYALSI